MMASIRTVLFFGAGIVIEQWVSLGGHAALLLMPIVLICGVILRYMPDKQVTQKVQKNLLYLGFVLLCGFTQASINNRIWLEEEPFDSAVDYIYGQLSLEEPARAWGSARYRLSVRAVGGPMKPPITVRPFDIYTKIGSAGEMIWYESGLEAGDTLDSESLKLKASAPLEGWYSVRNKSYAPIDNPGQFNARGYHRHQNIRYESELQAAFIPAGPKYAKSPITAIRERGIQMLEDGELVMGSISGIFQALIWGKKDKIDPHHRHIFNLIGLGHIIAVSGLHVGILLLPFAFFWAKSQHKTHYRKRDYLGGPSRTLYRILLAVLICLLLFVYAAFTGFGVSVIRATTMASAHVLLSSLGARSNTLNSLAWSGLLVLMWQPAQLMGPGFQLSYSAVIALVFLAPFLRRAGSVKKGMITLSTRKKKNSRIDKGAQPRPFSSLFHGLVRMTTASAGAMKTAFLVSLSLQLALLPLQMYYFEQISWVAPVVNALVLPLFTLSLPLAMVGAYGSVFVGINPWFLAALRPLSYLLEYLIQYGERIIALPFSWAQASFPKMSVYVMVMTMLVVVSITFLRHRFFSTSKKPEWGIRGRSQLSGSGPKQRANGLFLGLLMAVMLTGIRVGGALPPGLKVVFMKVGQGDAILVVLPNQRSMLIDSGPAWHDGVSTAARIKAAMDYFDLSYLDLLVHTHAHADHVGASKSLITQGLVREVRFNGLPYSSQTHKGWIEAAYERDVPVLSLEMGDRIILDPTTYIQLLSPYSTGAVSKSPNNSSLVIRIQYGSSTLLLTGDAEKETEEVLLAVYGTLLESDILKAGHHGSNTSNTPEFIGRVKPERVLISAGKDNRYGHPSPELLSRLDANKISYWDLSQRSALYLASDGIRWREVEW